MDIFLTIKETKKYVLSLKNQGKTVGFVPTMGALHKGHMALAQRAKKENDIALSSIFVNPLQFNDTKDLEKYPRTLEKDSEMLKSVGCDGVFAPSVDEMYGEQGKSEQPEQFDLGDLDRVMEGLQRPGHFQGVCVVVKKLFNIVEPDKAYFGEKDFQQLAVIKHMVKTLGMTVQIVPCHTVREADGLAMSSRNALLGANERKNAPLIYATLQKAKEEWKDGSVEGWNHLKISVEEAINKSPFLKLEYFEVVNSETLQPLVSWEDAKNIRACIAVKAGAVRLIDNISF